MLYPHPAKQNESDRVGIHEIHSYQPACVLPNAWYESLMARKFEKHTGIRERAVAYEDEVSLASRVLDSVSAASPQAIEKCAGLVLVTPSIVPASVASQFMPRERARREQPTRMAVQLCDRAQLSPRKIVGINGFCSGYAKAMKIVLQKMLPSLQLASDESILVITSNRISRITDFEDRQAGALFGDFATATVLTRCDNREMAPKYELLDADYEKQPAYKAFFDFSMHENVLAPTPEGGRMREPKRLVFSLDGMGIADTAPRAMAAAASEMTRQNDLLPSDIEHIVPHQAGEAIVRLTGMKLEEAGFTCAPVNGLTASTGNVSSGSVPYALQQNWDRLEGNILCPVAAVGAPGKAEVSQGCVLLRSVDQANASRHSSRAA